MATREEIKTIVYDLMKDATDGLVPEENVGMEYPQSEDDLPAVVYQMDIRPFPINGASASPSHTEYDSDGDVEYEEHREHVEGIFTISTRATNDTDAEKIYQDLRSEFGQYNFRHVADVKDLHEHIHRVSVQDVNDASDGDANVPARGDTMQVFVRFWIDYQVDEDNIKTIESNTNPN